MKQKYPTNFWEAAFSPSRDFIAVFILTLSITTLAGNLLFALLTGASDVTSEGVFFTVGVMIVFGLIAGFLWTNRRITSIPFHVTESQKLRPATAVIAIPSNVGMIGKIVRYHAGVVRHIWLVGDASQDTNARKCQEDYAADYLRIERVKTGHEEEAKNIYEGYASAIDAALELGISPLHMVADITGGTKTMSISAFLAAQARGVRVSYVQSNYEQIKGSDQIKKADEEFTVVEFDMSLFPGSMTYHANPD